MLKLIESVLLQDTEKYGFKKSDRGVNGHNALIKTVGALDIFIDCQTREFVGLGFYPVGDRIVSREIQDMITDGLVNIT